MRPRRPSTSSSGARSRWRARPQLAPLRVNVVSPGLTDTEAYAGMAPEARAAMLAKAASTLPAGRAGQVQDLAAGYLFLIDNPFVTGSVIDIDGGALIQ